MKSAPSNLPKDPVDGMPQHQNGMPQHQPLGRVPYIAVHAFCETSALISATTRASVDRRLSRADMTISPGGIKAAIKFFKAQPTPDLLLLESLASEDAMFADLEELAAVCDPKTKVAIIGASNDIALYRRLMESGIAEYLVGPVDPLSIIGTVLRLFPQNGAARMGKIYAFLGTKGGTGSSTLAQNVAWAMSQTDQKVLLIDMDLQFGTAALNYNIDAPVGFAEQLGDVDRLDEALIERLLHKRGPNLSVLAGATASQAPVEPAVKIVDRMLDLARATFPFVVLDLPHSWTPWVQQALHSSDEIIFTAVPDLANLRNAQGLMDTLKVSRPNDTRPRLVLNQAGLPKRAEIEAKKFASALQVDPAACIGFEPALFSAAANNGQMISETSRKSTAARAIDRLAQELSGHALRTKPAGRRSFWRR
ncbi:MAG: AAA family ATPase [Limimaricola soesokkakensis]|uniref:AAA family ATPase n=1 Tax=Limimaricola soesokkakensis TaxID=1343159 RepID=UPI004059A121